MPAGRAALGLLPLTCALLLGRAAAVRAERPLTSYPKAARDRYEAARRLQERKRYREALAAYEDAARLGMDDYPRLRVERGECLRQLKDFRAAIASHTNAITDGVLGKSCRH